MTQASRHVPAESDVLCETCGYTLNGLPGGARCPECGTPAFDSRSELRQLPAWEHPISAPMGFLRTTAQVLFQPTRFYRRLATRADRWASRGFALIHWALVSLLFGTAAWVHFNTYFDPSALPVALSRLFRPEWGIPLLTVLTFVSLELITRIAARATSWEAAYRGLRLPLPVVLRGLDYHAAHYLPVAAIALATVAGFRFLLEHGIVGLIAVQYYLYLLCAEVIVAAGYLFKTYWIGMRNMMFANA